jgi:DNA-binding MarR family transcriptional regulator
MGSTKARRRSPATYTHSFEDIAKAISVFSAVRRSMRASLAKGKKLDPSTWLRIETMKFIASHEKPKMKDISEYLSITAPSTSALMRGLIRTGLVTSYIDRKDRRSSRLTLTPKGKSELRKAIVQGIHNLQPLFAMLSKDELRRFVALLERMRHPSAL